MKKTNKKPTYLPRHAEPEPGAEITMRGQTDGGVTVSFSDGSDDLRVNRREFMRISGVAAATAAMVGTGCDAMRNPVEKVVPYVDRPEETRIGQFSTYASVWESVGILVKTRAGRPVKLEGNPKHPTSNGALSARGQSSYMKLYDPDRAHSPLLIKGDSAEKRTLAELDREIVAKLKSAGKSASVALLTNTLTGSAQQALVDELKAALPNFRHYTYDALNDESSVVANEASYGTRTLPHYELAKADLIVSLQSDFLGTWLSPVEFTRAFASRRTPDANMNRLVAFEGPLTLTGANADERHRVRTSNLVYVAMGLAHQVVLVAKRGPLASDGAASAALAPFTAEAVAKRTGLDAAVIQKVGAELAGKVSKSLVLAGGISSATPDGIALEAAVNLLNAALSADGNTIDRGRTSRQSGGQYGDLKQLVTDINASRFQVLIIAGPNPSYSAPRELKIGEAIKKVPTVISCNDRVDETSKFANWLAPASHYLESWGDALPFAGVYSIQQPVIRPLYQTRAFEEHLLQWFGQAGLMPSALPFLEATPAPPGNHPGGADFQTGAWYKYVRAHWERVVYPKAKSVNGFDDFWEAILRQGVWESPEASFAAPAFRTAATTALLPKQVGEPVARKGLKNKELVMVATVGLGDGADANNGHLQELPEPITKHVWGSFAMVSPKTFRDEKFKNGDIVELRPSGSDKSLKFPIIMVPGTHDDVVAIPLGYGRTAAGDVANELGSNAFALSREAALAAPGGAQLTPGSDGKVTRQILAGFEVGVTKTGENIPLAIPQGSQVLDVHYRGILSFSTLDAYKKDQTSGIHTHPPLKDLWDDHEYTLKWGMSVDLSKCTGCSACVIACQEENNIPVVGRQGVIEGREMHWLRIDRYYKLPDTEKLRHERASVLHDPMYASEPYVAMSEYLDETRVVFQPMMCQHCENAPCETVCPVLATMHSSDGLNQMAYNRCVGTRYCSNNCPFKVRRFNWYNYSTDRSEEVFAKIYPELKKHGRYNMAEPLQMAFNPEVTVRSRGVMEKCTFCVHRIRRAKWQAKKEGRTRMVDGDVVTACQQSCPADAITFGNLVDESSQVAQKHALARALSPLGEIGVESSVAYLTRVVNAEKVDPMGVVGGSHHGSAHGEKGSAKEH